MLLRTAWIASEAAKSLPDEKELGEFAKQLRDATNELARAAVETIGKPDGHSSMQSVAALYAALARRDDGAFAKAACDAIAAEAAGPQASLARQVAPVLFDRGGEQERAALVEAVRTGGAVGDDAVVLLALACRRAGDDAWSEFRAEAPELLGRQPLAGAVVVLVNQLSEATLPLVAAR